MNELSFVLQAALVLVATVTPLVVVVRLLAGRDTDTLGTFLQASACLPWPKGVQEEEFRPWKLGPSPI